MSTKMQIEYVAIDSIKPYEKNPRMNDKAAAEVAKSIKAYGWQQPIVVDKNNVIIAGHTRYKAAQMLKLKEVPVVKAVDLTEKQVKAYRIADNKVSDFSIWDNKLLLEELEDLGDMFTGFDLGDIMNLDILNEKDNEPLENNEYGTMYEIVFRSEDKKKIEEIKDAWEKKVNGQEQGTDS